MSMAMHGDGTLIGWMKIDSRHHIQRQDTCAKYDARQTGSRGTVGGSHCRRVVADQLGAAIGRCVATGSPRLSPLVKWDAVLL